MTVLVIDRHAEACFIKRKMAILPVLAECRGLPYVAKTMTLAKGPDGYGFLLRQEKLASSRRTGEDTPTVLARATRGMAFDRPTTSSRPSSCPEGGGRGESGRGGRNGRWRSGPGRQRGAGGEHGARGDRLQDQRERQQSQPELHLLDRKTLLQTGGCSPRPSPGGLTLR